MVTADSAVVHDDVPGPERNSVPLKVCVSCDVSRDAPHALRAYLLNLELLLSVGSVSARAGFGALDLGRGTCVGHLNVGHGCCVVLRLLCGMWGGCGGVV